MQWETGLSMISSSFHFLYAIGKMLQHKAITLLTSSSSRSNDGLPSFFTNSTIPGIKTRIPCYLLQKFVTPWTIKSDSTKEFLSLFPSRGAGWILMEGSVNLIDLISAFEQNFFYRKYPLSWLHHKCVVCIINRVLSFSGSKKKLSSLSSIFFLKICSLELLSLSFYLFVTHFFTPQATCSVIHWIKIYPVENVIYHWNNPAWGFNFVFGIKWRKIRRRTNFRTNYSSIGLYDRLTQYRLGCAVWNTKKHNSKRLSVITVISTEWEWFHGGDWIVYISTLVNGGLRIAA